MENGSSGTKGSGEEEQRVLMEPTATLKRHKWISYDSAISLSILSHFPLFLLRISNPSSSPPFNPLPQLSGYRIHFVTTQLFCEDEFHERIPARTGVLVQFLVPLSSVLIVLTSILAMITLHCDPWRIQISPWAVTL